MGEWFEVYENIVALAQWMRDQGRDIDDILYMLEKPWKFTDEWNEREAQLQVAGA